MFEIDDNFLETIGYKVDSLSQEQKQKIINKLSEELNARIADRYTKELTNEELNELNDIQGDIGRARRWLDEFHSDYRNREDYKQVLAVADDEDEAIKFYASALWMRYAIPGYGEIIKNELEAYHKELVDIRNEINRSLE